MTTMERLRGEWRDYRRGLDTREWGGFDALWDEAARLAATLRRPLLMEDVLILMLLAHEIQLRELRDELRALKS